MFFPVQLLFVFQTDKVIYLATEPITPLEIYLQNNSESHNELAISWGLHQIVVCQYKRLSFGCIKNMFCDYRFFQLIFIYITCIIEVAQICRLEIVLRLFMI